MNSWDPARNRNDEIVDEIHAWRKSYAARFVDLDKIFADLKNREAANPAPRAQIQPLKPSPSHRSER
jgi:hypothetical protein